MGTLGRRKNDLAFCWYVSLEYSRYPSSYPKLYHIGPDAPEHISSMVMDGNAVWVASSIYAIKYIRGKEVHPHFSI
jgi:hypothetical protein